MRALGALHGRVEAGFEPVADELAAIVDAGPDGGAAFAAFVDGVPVVDLWGGAADGATGEPWREDTILLVFSGTKGLVAACMLMLLERGQLELEAPVASYWPRFAGAGKGAITVAQALSHTAALPGLRDGFAASDLLDPARMIERVAAEAPFWPPGEQIAYHAITFGAICDGIVRGVDGRSAGRFFAEEVAAPLGLDLWIGLPPEQEQRVARLQPAADYGVTHLGDEPEPLLEAVYGQLGAVGFPWNDPVLHGAEIPAAGAIGSVRSIARLYASLARGGELDGVRLLSDEAVRLGRSELSRGVCAITKRPYAFGVGFELQTELGSFGAPAAAFGHTGSGGSCHGAWPLERVGFSFASTELWPEARDDRARRLLSALARSLRR